MSADALIERCEVSIVIPALNEERGVAVVVSAVRSVLERANLRHEVLVVDDGSTDRTGRVASNCGAVVLSHESPQGYGAAIRTGFRAARYGALVIIDADGTYPADAIPDMVARLKDADMVVGARGRSANVSPMRRPAKWLLRCLAEYLTRTKIPDLNSGLRAFKRDSVLPYEHLLPEGFSLTTTITVAMLSDRRKVEYLPINYGTRIGRSKIQPVDFITFVALVLRLSVLFNPLRLFVPISLVLAILGVAKLLADVGVSLYEAGGFSAKVFSEPTISTSALMLLLSGLQVLVLGAISDALNRRIAVSSRRATYVSSACPPSDAVPVSRTFDTPQEVGGDGAVGRKVGA
jgi:glycosyltransferase involved in cell wall biosynthesis